MTKLFERDDAGLLHEVAADRVEDLRAGRRVSHVVIGAIEVLWTDEEEAAAFADEEARRVKQEARAAAATAKAEQRAKVVSKLEALGITADELKTVLS
jgi:hypothetical protein